MAPRAASAGTRILIAEDAEYNLLLVKAYLKDTGYQLDVAVNGKIAVEKVISGHPDLVLMDLEMPVMDGLEATRAIRQWEAETHTRPVPILALTAHADGEEAGRSLEAEMYRTPYQTDQEGHSPRGHFPLHWGENPHHPAAGH